VGPVGPQGGVQRRQQHLISRVSVRAAFGPARRIPGRCGAARRRVPGTYADHTYINPYETPPPQPQRTPEQLLQASWVYVRRGGTTQPLTPPYAGPYEVLEPGEKTFLIRIGNREDRVSVDRLKTHLGKEPVQPAAPGRHGRPKNVQEAASVVSPPTYAEVAAGGGPSVVVLQRSSY
jgi:hypothetical protein